ncbi:hypothetical protein EJB05_25577, partial [Eragrostis curvula]
MMIFSDTLFKFQSRVFFNKMGDNSDADGLVNDESPPHSPNQQQNRRRRVYVRKVSSSKCSGNPDSDFDDDFEHPKVFVPSSAARHGKAANSGKARHGKAARNAEEEKVTSSKSGGADDEDFDEDAKEVATYYANVRCSPACIANILSEMPEHLKKRIEQLGFPDIVKFKCDGIDDRALAMYLMNHIKFNPLRIEIKGRSLPITPQVVHDVMGTPIGGRDLPKKTYQELKSALASLRAECDGNGMESLFAQVSEQDLKKSYKDLKKSEVPRWVMERWASSKKNDDWTMKCFFLLLSNALLFPRSTNNITGHDCVRCSNLDDMKQYDWSKGIVDDIAERAREWQQKGNTAASPSVQGCVLFLIIYYLDNLLCDHMIEDAMTTPRASLFTSSVIEKIAKADKKSLGEKRYSFGHLPWRDQAGTCYQNVGGDRQQAAQAHPIHDISSDSDEAVCARGGPQRRREKDNDECPFQTEVIQVGPKKAVIKKVYKNKPGQMPPVEKPAKKPATHASKSTT